MARRIGLQVCALVVAALLMVGCGSGHAPPPNCLQVQPCGGDVVGTWSFLGTCSDLAAQNQQLQLSCPGASLGGASTSLTGVLTFNTDSSYTATNWHEAFGGTETLPLTCAGTTTCAENNRTTNDSTDGVTVHIATTCSGTSTCACRISGTLDVTTNTGSYSTSSPLLVLTGGLSSTFSYCVEENRLHLMQTLASDSSVIVSDIVAERQ